MNAPEEAKPALTAAQRPIRRPSIARWTDLQLAVLSKDAEKVESLLQQGAAPDAGISLTPLMLACIGTPASLDKLHQSGEGHELLLSIAPKLPGAASLTIVKQLLAAGACPTAERKQVTPLLLAIATGDLPIVKALLAAQTAKQLEQSALSPLVTAASLGRAFCLARLMMAGADPNHSYPKEMKFPLHVAAELKDVECCKLLLQYGADPNAAVGGNQRALHDAVSKAPNSDELSKKQRVSVRMLRAWSIALRQPWRM